MLSICEMIRVTPLKELQLSHNHVTSQGLKRLVPIIAINKTLTTLVLSSNPLGDAGAKLVAAMLAQNHVITRLELSDASIGLTGALGLADVLESSAHLEHVDLSWNHIRSPGSGRIASSFHSNTTLTRLYLSWNGFSDECALVLASAVQNNLNIALQTLDLSNNRITSRGVAALRTAIAEHKSTEQFDDVRLQPQISGKLLSKHGDAAAAFSNADEGKIVEIKNGSVKVDGVVRAVCWEKVRPVDCEAQIVNVEPNVQGKVKLNNSSEFENPVAGDVAGTVGMLQTEAIEARHAAGWTLSSDWFSFDLSMPDQRRQASEVYDRALFESLHGGGLCGMKMDGQPYKLPLDGSWEVPQHGRFSCKLRVMPEAKHGGGPMSEEAISWLLALHQKSEWVRLAQVCSAVSLNCDTLLRIVQVQPHIRHCAMLVVIIY